MHWGYQIASVAFRSRWVHVGTVLRTQSLTSSSCYYQPLLPSYHAPQGRPKGENKEEDKKKYSLKPVVSRLSQLIGQDVSYELLD